MCLHGLAAVAAAADAPAYDDLLDALDALLRTCHERREWLLGVNFGELALGPRMQARVVEVLSTREVPLFYFSANYSFKAKLKEELRGARQRREGSGEAERRLPVVGGRRQPRVARQYGSDARAALRPRLRAGLPPRVL